MISEPIYNSTQILAKDLALELERQNKKIVLAESCTAGLAAALLAQTSGISNWLCGSVVTYMESAKQDWLKIDPQLIHQHTAVSPQVTTKMAESVLHLTRAADFSVAITGHLEPNATDDGTIAYVAIGYRKHDKIVCTQPTRYLVLAHSRVERQWEAARAALNSAMQYLRFPATEETNTVEGANLYIEPKNFHWDHRN